MTLNGFAQNKTDNNKHYPVARKFLMFADVFPQRKCDYFDNDFIFDKEGDDSKPITRAELAQLFSDFIPSWLSYNYIPDPREKPIDVDISHPNYQAIQQAIDMGIMEKYNQRIYPDSSIARYDLSVFIARVVDKIEHRCSISYTKLHLYVWFPDVKQGHYASYCIKKMTQEGFIQGNSDGNFHGKNPATIKEVKIVLHRIKEKTEALLKEKEAQNKPSLEPSNP